MDTANRTPDDRDARRILTAAQMADLKKIDMLLSTHYHGDHIGAMPALANMIPIGQYLSSASPKRRTSSSARSSSTF